MSGAYRSPIGTARRWETERRHLEDVSAVGCTRLSRSSVRHRVRYQRPSARPPRIGCLHALSTATPGSIEARPSQPPARGLFVTHARQAPSGQGKVTCLYRTGLSLVEGATGQVHDDAEELVSLCCSTSIA